MINVRVRSSNAINIDQDESIKMNDMLGTRASKQGWAERLNHQSAAPRQWR
jgi:hypothetical protein